MGRARSQVGKSEPDDRGRRGHRVERRPPLTLHVPLPARCLSLRSLRRRAGQVWTPAGRAAQTGARRAAHVQGGGQAPVGRTCGQIRASNFTGTTATNWGFIPGSFCGTCVRARNAMPSESRRKQDSFVEAGKTQQGKQDSCLPRTNCLTQPNVLGGPQAVAIIGVDRADGLRVRERRSTYGSVDIGQALANLGPACCLFSQRTPMLRTRAAKAAISPHVLIQW